MGSPAISASGFMGRRVEARRAGIRTIGLGIRAGTQRRQKVAKRATAIRVANLEAKQVIIRRAARLSEPRRCLSAPRPELPPDGFIRGQQDPGRASGNASL